MIKIYYFLKKIEILYLAKISISCLVVTFLLYLKVKINLPELNCDRLWATVWRT